jgi:hypothetical protein
VPQVPQLRLSLPTSTHCPEQLLSPLGHATTQTPAEQAIPGPQALLHAPQLAGSDWMLAQVVPQTVSPGGQVVTQLPCRQAVPTPQTCPHWPQFRLSLPVLTHCVLQ